MWGIVAAICIPLLVVFGAIFYVLRTDRNHERGMRDMERRYHREEMLELREDLTREIHAARGRVATNESLENEANNLRCVNQQLTTELARVHDEYMDLYLKVNGVKK